MTVGKRLFPVRWHRCMRGAIMAAGPFFAYFLWANKESKRRERFFEKKLK
jgi:hypothetical protein